MSETTDLYPNKTGLNGQGNLIKETTTAQFQADVMEQSRNQPVLVDFWAPWCGPCKQLGPIIEQAVREANGSVKLVKMNIDEHPAIAGQLGVRSIPTVVAFVNGQPVDAFMGAKPENEIKAFIAKLGGQSAAETLKKTLEAAQSLIDSGDIVQAADIYAHILQNTPDSIAAIAGLARCFLEMDNIEQARAVLATAPQDKAQDPLLVPLHARLRLIEQSKTIGDPATLKQAIAANPQDYQARFDLALIYNAQAERAQAADMLLAIMQDNREWQDDGARKQLLQFFDIWGAKDPATLAARRKLSALLFS